MNSDLRTTFGDDLGDQLTGWRAQDPDPSTRRALDALIERAAGGDPAARDELADAFDGRLAFGTAGLRGALGPGPNRMNRVVVAQAAAGLAGYLNEQGLAGRVLIGYDARHESDVFARDSAEILAGAGFEPVLVDRPLPTPLVSFGIGHLGCIAGVMVTASHNPAQDNGYKVYLGDGSQIVPPVDNEIAAKIDQVARQPLTDIPRSEAVTVIGDELIDAYLDRLATLVDDPTPRELSWVYTPMHGVGGAIVTEALRRTGFAPPYVIGEQAEPDPDFPTVAFPNPEEPGAIDLALAAARERGADLVIANDPDADRCAVAAEIDGEWRMLTGDELGVLLAQDALDRGVSGTYACSIVSGSLLSAMAAAHDQPFCWTLTGFKWIGRVPGLAFGYEEAIGYCCDPEAVPDKDGISTLLLVLGIAARLKAGGHSLADRLTEITARYGPQLTAQLSFRVQDLSTIRDAMTRLRSAPPTRLAGEDVSCVDLAESPAGRGGPDLPPSDGLLFTGETIRVVVRPSGTEPKLKCYLEVRRDRDATVGLQQLRDQMTTAVGL